MFLVVPGIDKAILQPTYPLFGRPGIDLVIMQPELPSSPTTHKTWKLILGTKQSLARAA